MNEVFFTKDLLVVAWLLLNYKKIKVEVVNQYSQPLNNGWIRNKFQFY